MRIDALINYLARIQESNAKVAIFKFKQYNTFLYKMDPVVFPVILVYAVIGGFMLNSCSRRKTIEKLERERDQLLEDLRHAMKKLDDANEKLYSISEDELEAE